MFGTTQLFVFHHPDQERKAPGTFAEVSFELAQEEIQAKAGFTVDHEDQTMEQAILSKDLLEVLPAIEEANGISEELERNTRFEVMLIAPQILGKTTDRTEVSQAPRLFFCYKTVQTENLFLLIIHEHVLTLTFCRLNLTNRLSMKVFVKVVNVETGTEHEWSKEKFLDRLYLMREMYQNFEHDEDWEVPLEKDPFYEDPSLDAFIGSAQLFLQV
jgi:hypothetical protein